MIQLKICGIITEYNPFHNGHLYHLKKAKKISDADYVICIMNGNFMQRGYPALLDKWTRTKMALAAGVDLVIELPLIYGIRSAEYFASGAVNLLEKTGLISTIVFGSEDPDMHLLQKIANILLEEPPAYRVALKSLLASGINFPEARNQALVKYLTNCEKISNRQGEKISEIINRPNNILAIEYLKSLLKLNSSIKAVSIKRYKTDYHAMETNEKIASATAIRKILKNNNISTLDKLNKVKPFVPHRTYQEIELSYIKNNLILDETNFSAMLLSKIRTLTPAQLLTFAEVNNGLENRIVQQARKSGNYQDLIKKITTRAYTETRIKRNLLHILFNLTATQFSFFKNQDLYLRVLGIKKGREDLLSMLHKKSSLPLIINPAEYLRDINLNHPKPLERSLSYDILSSDLYTLLRPVKGDRQARKDFHTPLLKV